MLDPVVPNETAVPTPEYQESSVCPLEFCLSVRVLLVRSSSASPFAFC